jgi:glutathione reductase (NADPH)
VAREQLGAVDVYRSSFRALKHTLGDQEEKTFMKLVRQSDDAACRRCPHGRPDAGEIMQGIAIAVKLARRRRSSDARSASIRTAAEEFVTMRNKAA